MAQYFFRLVFYVPMNYRVPEKEKEAEDLAKKFSIKVSGRKIRGFEWGSASDPYILVIHGWAGRATQFRKFIKPLNGSGFRLVGFDGPAHGKSQGTKTSILEFEQMLRQIIKELGEPSVIIAHSFGGAAALYAAMHGLPVNRLINIASPYIADEILKTYLRAIHGSWLSAEKFKEYVLKKTGKTFEEFTALFAIQHIPRSIDLFMVQDENDQDVLMIHAEALQKVYPAAKLLKTVGLGHTRILKDEKVIEACIGFIKANHDPVTNT